MKTCMEAHGYEYTSSCFKQDFNSVRIAICLPSAEKNDPGPPFKSPLQVCTQDEQGMTAVRETSAWCYKPTAFLAKVTWQLIGPAEPDMWCYQAREDFQAAVRLPGYLWTRAAKPLLPGSECEKRAAELTPAERERLNQI